MKKIISFAIIMVNLILLGSFTGCQTLVGDKNVIVGAPSIMYKDIIYYLDHTTLTIKYQTINNIQETGLPLYQDVLSSNTENPLSNISSAVFLIDETETIKNDGSPVLIIACRKISGSNTTFNILTFDTKTNHIKILKENVAYVQSLHLYDGYIIYACDEGDKGYNVYSMKKDGSDHCVLENPDHDGYRVRNIKDDFIYVTDSLGNLYASTLDLKNLTYLFDGCDTPVFFYNDYVYYTEYGSYLLCRRPLFDLSQKEVILEDKVRGFVRSGPEYMHLKPNEKNNFDLNVVYIFDAETGIDTLVYENTDSDRFVAYEDFTEKYILFSAEILNIDGSGTTSMFLIYDMEEQKEIYIPM